MDLSNKVYVVTGATSGIGLATASELARAGAQLIGVGRSQERCNTVEKSLRALNPRAEVRYLIGDLSIQSEVRKVAGEIGQYLDVANKPCLDGLIHVAGAFTYWLDLTPEGIERQWAVNHLAAFLLTRELLPRLIAAPQARVITVSSGSHHGAKIRWDDPQLRRNYNGLQAYGVTKLANVLFTLELNRRLEAYPHVRAFAVDPGLVKTDIGYKDNPPLVSWIWKIRRSGGTSPGVPAGCILYLLSEPSVMYTTSLYWKNSRPEQPSRAALDQSAAAQLWALSEKLCGI